MRFKQVLLNYQSNAVKFTPDNGTVKIRCTLKKENREDLGIIKVQVIDSGIGISEENQQKLFKLFGYVEEVRDTINTQGIGMGLHITKKLVEHFGGKVQVRSKVGEGSTFEFSFKLS